MNSLVLLILVAAAVAVHANSAYDTPAARFWEKALPGTRMPEAIADLAQEGTDHSPLKEHRAAPYLLPSECLRYGVGCPSGSKAMPPGLFFLETQARVGSTMTVSFSPAAVPPILPRDAAKTVPFGNLADVLATFNIAASSGEAEKIGNTLTACKTSVPGEKMMTCTTSVEATVESAVHMLVAGGKNNDDGVVWAAASGLSRHGLPRQAYVLDAVTALDGDRHVACHAMPFPYAVFQCHMTDERSKAYTMTLQGLQGGAHVGL
ncbi:hypothetical protein PR202_gb28126 [Eleusine coracana subsp. coracana]|uniref:BURP domain-containing protein n=1 Tax=Eleusine coracana subsp. coracana TaxID=191504 RepID=A0AAV5FVJ9_ELECO|nr:hypothetical protein PR202_gb28126 [Eleusine coracana subsp. coracana]